MADKASEYGIELADISEEAIARIPQRRTAILTNPFDTAGASRSPGFLSGVCEAFAADTANDCLLMYLGPLAVRHEYARNFAAASEKFGKTAAAIIMLSEPDVREIFQAHHVPVFDAATDACFATLRGYIDYGRYLRRNGAASKNGVVKKAAPAETERIISAHRGAAMLPHEATSELLGAYGFKCAQSMAAATSAEAKAAAAKLGYPVILKAMVPNVAHRSDAGLVSAKLANSEELQQALTPLQGKARALLGGSDLVNVEKFIPHDFEVILGVKYDPTFGPVILCGLGGIFTEVLKDFALRLAPLARVDAEDMLLSLKAFPILEKSGSLAPLVDALLRLSDLAVSLQGKINAVDINPIGLSMGSSELTVLDAKIHL
jgi:acetyltransferase